MNKRRFLSASWLETAPFMDGHEVVVIKSPDSIQPNDVLVLWGGEDIRPALYNHPRHSSTGRDSERDVIEWALLQRAIDSDIPIIGICRGAQMLCARAGGSLVQDVRGHSGHHFIYTTENKKYVVNSIHHQQMYLEEIFPEKYTTLAWAMTKEDDLVVGHSHEWKDNQPIKVSHEPEAVWFPEIKGLAIQWHPEYMENDHPTQDYVNRLVKHYALGL